MKFFSKSSLISPPDNEKWELTNFGFSMFELRVISYLSIIIFFIINGGGLFIFESAYANDFQWILQEIGYVFGVVYIAIFVIFYYLMHEAIHLLNFPERGRSENALVGIMSFAVFVLYNGEISRKQLMKSVISPAIYLSPFVMLFFLISPGLLSANLVGLHFTACFGDFLLYRKLAKRTDVSLMWSTGERVWVKK